jgi:hypothetical protein
MPGQGSYSQVNKGGNLGDVANLGISIFSWSVFPVLLHHLAYPVDLVSKRFFGPLKCPLFCPPGDP